MSEGRERVLFIGTQFSNLYTAVCGGDGVLRRSLGHAGLGLRTPEYSLRRSDLMP
jgi:hypothetical protein